MRRRRLQADPDQQREERRHQQQQLVAAAEEGDPELVGENLRFARTGPGDSGPATLVVGWTDVRSALVSSTFDIEALPGQADEKILQAGGLHRQSAAGG